MQESFIRPSLPIGEAFISAPIPALLLGLPPLYPCPYLTLRSSLARSGRNDCFHDLSFFLLFLTFIEFFLGSFAQGKGWATRQPQGQDVGSILGCDDPDRCESLEGFWDNEFVIPDEFVLHAPLSGQHLYDPFPNEFSVSSDTLKAGLQFSLHPMIEECLEWWRVSSSQIAPNLCCYMIVFLGEYRGVGIVPIRNLFMAYFCLYKGQGGYYLTARYGFRVLENLNGEIVYPCIPDLDGEDEGGQASFY
ncbi:hypothetical protein B296_00033071 [Ensete ventricosum]|uniref:Uncharacterized protein n=1 Tax=Ensete ventricosum TaxID=4639 RepID=A0A426YS94_ENSVE|nr:hypothetical protein B296_00033071 [Ensete ventricosum]